MGKRVIKTRNNGEWSEARYWQQVRSALRSGFRYWKPIQQARINARRKYKGNNKRQKWEFQCAECKKWFKQTDTQIDHKIAVGSLKSNKDLIGFLERLTPEDVNNFQCLCKSCHKEKTKKEREDGKVKRDS